ncbi:unnamed protein product [Pseudo-nitzschia multistriata]|uniref:Uncharacterized protein n=1 Tax=Pseudo-nitzschia multistriata TaxID=183589 RepID=A0A448ZGQ4_9STRA|nr:unnamed protein product [Pseudo-nitzschia multistriata]
MRWIVCLAFLILYKGKEIDCFNANPTSSRGVTFVCFRQRQSKELNVRKSKSSDLQDDDKGQRRRIIKAFLSAPLSIILPTGESSIASATSGEIAKTKPFAPMENLLPAVRVKLSIDSATELTQSLMAAKKDEETPKQNREREASILHELEKTLLGPQNYVQSTLKLQGVPAKPGDLYLDSYKSMKGDLPFQQFLIKNGDIDSWKRLKKAEKNMERSSEVRAALNAYTDALTFSTDSYLLTVDRDARSRMVREDRLPDVKQVITSDMGMRYLYRNQVLTAMEDVKAELEYQLMQAGGDQGFDGSELLELLGSAGTAMDRWLSLVPPEDLKQAQEFISTEER